MGWLKLLGFGSKQGAGQQAASVPEAVARNIERLGSPDAQATTLALSGLSAAPFSDPGPVDGQREATPTLAQAEGLVRAGRSVEALAFYEGIAAADPGCVEAWFRIGILRQEAGDVPEALEAWARAVSLDPTQWIAAQRLGMTLTGLGRNVAAAACLEAALPHVHPGSDFRVHLSVAYAALGWWDLAAAAMAAMPESLPGWWEETRRKALSNLAEQRELLERPKRLTRIGAMIATGALEDAESGIAAVLADRPRAFDAHAARASLLLRTQGSAAAIEALLAADLPKRHGEARDRLLATLLQEDGQSQRAASLLLPSLAGPKDEVASLACAIAALASGDDALLRTVADAWRAQPPPGEEPTIWSRRFTIAVARREKRVARLHDGTGARAGSEITPAIVQFWNDAVPPDDVAETMASWPRLNPGAAYRRFDTESGRAFLADHAPQLLGHYDTARHAAMQSDILRLAVLAEHGGVYADSDERCERLLDDIFAALAHVDFVAWLSTNTPPYADNAFIAARPGCEIVRWALVRMEQDLARHAAEGARPDIWETTGPGLITRSIGRFLSRADNAGRVLFLTDQEKHAFGCTVELAYKSTPEGNWRLH